MFPSFPIQMLAKSIMKFHEPIGVGASVISSLTCVFYIILIFILNTSGCENKPPRLSDNAIKSGSLSMWRSSWRDIDNSEFVKHFSIIIFKFFSFTCLIF